MFVAASVRRRHSWSWRLSVAIVSMASALALTHACWRFLEHTPFLLGFAAAILAARLGGRTTGFLAVFAGLAGYTAFPPPLPTGGLGALLFGFGIVSSTFSWLVARRYEVEADLRASEERLRAVLSNLPVVLWVIDREGIVSLAEGSGLEVLDLKPHELRGRPVLELYRGSMEADANTRRVLAGETFTAVITLGDVVVETWYSPVRNQQAAVIGAIGVSLDVTTRRRLEEQYLQSQKMEAVGQLAAGVAHDFNNLLTAIGGYTELVLLTLRADDARREDLQEVAKASQRAAALTRHLLAFSRRQALQPTVLDVNATVADIQKLLRRTIPESIDLQLELRPSEPVRADRGQLEQVVLNLVINAADAMRDGGELRVATETVDVDDASALRHGPMRAGRYVLLTVTDTGTGMSPETQSRIFEPFFSTKERGRGTGLGLATVYGIVKQSAGFIWCDSELGRGTTFAIYLPVVHERIDTSEESEPVPDLSEATQTVLLAEDDGAVRRLTRDVLASHGYTVLAARDGDEALLLARQHPGTIHLLIADIVMPGLSGPDLAARLHQERPDLRLLYTSGYTENMLLRTGFENGVAVLRKPFLPADMLRKVQEVLRPTDCA